MKPLVITSVADGAGLPAMCGATSFLFDLSFNNLLMPQPILANAFVDLFLNGGPIMWPIAIVSLFAVAIIMERCWWWVQLSIKRKPQVLERVLTALEEGA